MSIVFYSTHCPKCRILEKKLKEKNISYTESNDIDEMTRLGLKSAPALVVDGELKEFKGAVDWVNAQEG